MTFAHMYVCVCYIVTILSVIIWLMWYSYIAKGDVCNHIEDCIVGSSGTDGQLKSAENVKKWY